MCPLLACVEEMDEPQGIASRDEEVGRIVVGVAVGVIDERHRALEPFQGVHEARRVRFDRELDSLFRQTVGNVPGVRGEVCPPLPLRHAVAGEAHAREDVTEAQDAGVPEDDGHLGVGGVALEPVGREELEAHGRDPDAAAVGCAPHLDRLLDRVELQDLRLDHVHADRGGELDPSGGVELVAQHGCAVADPDGPSLPVGVLEAAHLARPSSKSMALPDSELR